MLRKFSTYLLIIVGLSTSPLASAQKSIQITGSFYDDSTGLDLPTKVYSISGGAKKYLGQSHRKEVFDHKYAFTLETPADSLIFESPGFHPGRYPVHYFGKFLQNTRAQVGEKTLKIHHTLETENHVVFCWPENTDDNTYEELHYYGSELHCVQPMQARSFKKVKRGPNTRNSHFVIQIKSPEGELLSEVPYEIKTGINFVDLSVYPPGESMKKLLTEENTIRPVPQETVIPEEPQVSDEPHEFEKSGIPSIYFDQGKFTLSHESKLILDQLQEYLGRKQDLSIIIKGFTDQVGDPQLNRTLAKYRAQVTSSYLKDKGLNPSRMQVVWEDDIRKATNEEADLSKYRKVTLTEIP